MRCPFRFRPPKRRYSFGVAGDFLDYIEEQDRRAEAEYDAAYPTCWLRFLHWLGRV
jgi:hypothetical protein